ncbi:zinc finger BED domain-containing protein 5 [Aplysia californica]|uniref:Zinc finger BED domain-containing protein 5 n=1 Tax=Aplysia californica TaxID=6500 RepID=A0ABM0JFQ3_APLCA|nr:zinc finger BED domain-containing protein 5 [Aplysia californica]
MVKYIAKIHKDTLMERMKTSPFSPATDGSSDSNVKLYPIVVRTLNVKICEVHSEVASLPVLDVSGTGENIFNLLDALLQEGDIPWTNCVSFDCDNASVMTGVHKGVFSFIKKKNPECFLSGCTLHLVHLAAEKAADKLPSSPADLLVDIYYHMKKSSVRQMNLGKYQEYYGKEQQ